MRRYFYTVCFMLFWLLYSGIAIAHEPIFGLGAHTLYQGGYGIEVEWEGEEAGDEKESAIEYNITYGITPDFTLILIVPQFLEKEEGRDSSSGLGDLSIRGKYRFIRIDEPGATTGVAVNLGVKLPSGDETKTPSLGTGSQDFLAGLAVTRESLRHYFFSDIRYRMNTEANGIRKGNVFFFDIAYGIRPWRIEYLKPDLVLVIELNYEREERTRNNKVKNIDTGGDRLFVSPGFLLSYRNVMFKGGVQIPASQDLNGNQEDVDYRALFSIELHL
ncbi:MAG: transporter [Thermodesulfobacteriota bacterium]